MLLITGSAGFIGSQVVQGLNKKGIKDIILVDELQKDQRWKNLVGLQYCDYFEKTDWLEEIKTNNVLAQEITGCIHLGACSSTMELDASFLIKNNFGYSKNLAKWCLDNDICFVYASSAATYGDGGLGYNDEEPILHLSSLNIYGYSKQMFDQWLYYQGCFKNKRTGVYGLKYFNVYGPGENHKGNMKSMVAKAYTQIKKEKKVQLFKSHHPSYQDGEQMRDFIFVEDAVAMSLFLLDNKAQSGVYNVGTGIARTWVDMMKVVFDSLDLPCHIEFVEMPESIRSNYQYFTQATMEKISKAGFDLKQMHSLEEGVKKYISVLNRS